jgi:hypothetical protein
MLIDLDDRTARDLERVAPSRMRVRAEFVRLAIRAAIDRAMDRATQAAYRASPLGAGAKADEVGDLSAWDPHNALARRKRGRRKAA